MPHCARTDASVPRKDRSCICPNAREPRDDCPLHGCIAREARLEILQAELWDRAPLDF